MCVECGCNLHASMSSWQLQSLCQLNTTCSEEHLSCMHISALRPCSTSTSEHGRWSATAGPWYSKCISVNKSTADHVTSQLVSPSPGFVHIAHNHAAAHSCHATAQAHLQSESLPGLEQVPEPPAGAGQAHVEAVTLTNIPETARTVRTWKHTNQLR